MKFTDLDLNADILDALQDLGYESPTPIQHQAIPAAIEGRDVLGTAQTGADGKIIAFLHPKATGGSLIELCQSIGDS